MASRSMQTHTINAYEHPKTRTIEEGKTYLAVPSSASVTAQFSYSSGAVVPFPDNLIFPLELSRLHQMTSKMGDELPWLPNATSRRG